MNVYVGKTLDGEVIIDAYPNTLGDAVSVTSVPFEEYRKLGHYAVKAVFEGDKPVLKLDKPLMKKKKISDLKKELEEIDKLSGAGRSFRKTVTDMGEILSAVKGFVAGFKNFVEEQRENDPDFFAEFDSDVSPFIEKITEFDFSEHYDIKKIAQYEQRAEVLREELNPLLNPLMNFSEETA